MANPDAALMTMVKAIVADDSAAVSKLLAANPALATAHFAQGAARRGANVHFIDAIKRYIFAGDTALHIAAAAYRPNIVRKLLQGGAEVRAKNRRGAEPLHAAAAGAPGSASWNPRAQAATVSCLIEAGADPNALNQDGVAPLHVAVRTRCAAAVQALLDGGADPRRKNKNGSTPILLATRNTGRGGTGAPEAKAQQAEIVQLLQQYTGKRSR
jgi:Ankyrin repeats (many copies)/Ankyrin repeat